MTQTTETLAPADIEARATQEIAKIRTQLAEMTTARDAAAGEVARIEAQIEAAREQAQTLARVGASITSRVAAARARLLVVEGSGDEAAARAELAAVEQEQTTARTDYGATTQRAIEFAVQLAVARGMHVNASATLDQRRGELEQVVTALDQQRQEARHAAGLAALAHLRQNLGAAEQRLADAEAAAAAAKAQIAATRDQAAQLLRNNPALSEAVRPILPQRETPATKILVAYAGLLRAVEPYAGKGAVPLVAGRYISAYLGGMAEVHWQHMIESRGGEQTLAQRQREIETLIRLAEREA